MTDPRITEYAHLLIDYCLKVQPGWQVLILASPLARPLIEEVVRQVARKGAYALTRVDFPSTGIVWARDAPEALVGEMALIDRHAHEHSDAEMIYEYPAVWGGEDVEGIRLVFRGGKVVEASVRRGEELLLSTIDADAGARVPGELGLGCNPHIQRFTRNVLFDEKIYGTIHLALGSGFPRIGGTHVSSIHWDIVKDMRRGGTRIYCDGEIVQQDGRWVF